MILFNLVFLKNNFTSIPIINTNKSYYESKWQESNYYWPNKLHLAYIFKEPQILSEDKYKIAKSKYSNKRFGHSLIHSLWKQDLFLSLSHNSFNKYNFSSSSNSFNLNKRQNDQKFLMLEFSKALFTGSIQVSFIEDKMTSPNNLLNIQYSWSKKIHYQLLKLNRFFQEDHYKNDLKLLSENINTKVNLDYLPLFTVSNHLGQMIISEPPTDLNAIDYIESYSSIKSYRNHLYHGFFFTSYKDAEEYMNYIQDYYQLDKAQLRIFTCKFDLFYKIMNKFNQGICFKLIPDLTELSNLLKSYRYHRNLSFHKQQIYSRNSFQGQPLYLLRNNQGFLPYNFLKKYTQKYNLGFLNYEDVLQVYKKLKKNIGDNRIKNLSITVYNLEKFIQEQRIVNSKEQESYLIIPSKTSYFFASKSQLKSYQDLVYESYLNNFSRIILWSKRIFWSLTSRKP